MRERNLRLKGIALLLAARQALFPRSKLPITALNSLFGALPEDFRIIVADVGSIGGLHSRWRPLRPHLVTLNFDPLDQGKSSDRERYFPFLLGASDGRGSLKVTRRPSMSSTLDPKRSFYAPFWNKPDDVEIEETLAANVTTLDAIAARENLWPDALKIDVQGGEARVLDGAEQALGRSVLLAEIECSFAERYEGQETFDQIIARMRGHGFALLDLRRLKRYRYRNDAQVKDPSLGRGMRAGRLAFCDAIFIREPQSVFDHMSASGDDYIQGLKFMILALTYGKPDLASVMFDRIAERLPSTTRHAFGQFFKGLAEDGGSTQQLHHEFDAWSQRV